MHAVIKVHYATLDFLICTVLCVRVGGGGGGSIGRCVCSPERLTSHSEFRFLLAKVNIIIVKR